MLIKLISTLLVLFSGLAHAGDASAESPLRYGVKFKCNGPSNSVHIEEYLNGLGVNTSWLAIENYSDGVLVRLLPELGGESTLGISRNPIFKVSADIVELLDPRLVPRQVATVSKKEIMLALLHSGRFTEFTGLGCGLEQLKDDIGVRQLTVAWAQTLNYGWPEGGPAAWNEKYWTKGNPNPGVNLHSALVDMVVNPSDYSIGCYTAAKMVIAASSIDYYTRVKNDDYQASMVLSALMSDEDPLVDIEPGISWQFESDYDVADNAIPGKILNLITGVAALNFVPGDWIYLLNTDKVSYEKTGYEGSNAIYLGFDKFSDYYNDHEHSFSFKQKVNEVFQWRNGVFSRAKDALKVVPLTDADHALLSKSPSEGGLLLSHRLVPRPVAQAGPPLR